MDDYTGNVGRLKTEWALLKELASGSPLPPRFAEAIAKADSEFSGSDFAALRTKTLKALVAGQPARITDEQWTPMTIAKLVACRERRADCAGYRPDAPPTSTHVPCGNWLIQLGLIAAALALVCRMMVVVSRRVSRPLFALNEAMGRLADGDFAVTIPGVGRKDEVGMIAAAAAEAVVERVGATIGNIKTAANEVTNASAEISTSTTDLSQRTEEQAASLEETSASMEEIARNGEAQRRERSPSQRLRDGDQRRRRTRRRRGGQRGRAMARIEESSRKISDIIGVIDEIARQTNLLALNAAVEAARAGDAGRGFAVVASEVRSLAQRSSQAAKDIKDLITNSNSQVKDGVDLVNKAGESLNEIVASIKKVATIVAEIANASVEQSTGIEQVNKALSQMDEVTQQNSALVEENAATAKTLEQQAKSMDQRVAAFRLRGRCRGATRWREARPSPTRRTKPMRRADMRQFGCGAASCHAQPKQAAAPGRGAEACGRWRAGRAHADRARHGHQRRRRIGRSSDEWHWLHDACRPHQRRVTSDLRGRHRSLRSRKPIFAPWFSSSTNMPGLRSPTANATWSMAGCRAACARSA